jgi:phosphoribosylglycinamide formyltransferase-1
VQGDHVLAWNVDLICLAGFMRIISRYLIERWPDKIVNIHPSMLPSYPGLNVHKRVFEEGEEYSGCTVHYVREKVDFGPGIVQARVPIAGLNPDGIAGRILKFEHLIYP